ncbi:SspB family protein [Indioceanicola profundi]|uniref:SspB family protein n=1 Tax=Indioceanicola profundi TaxID=2220096 RepID=UPI000E6AA86D|nr:ClpXP protease specificity-enhancing factor SspB [Indioceanicola profundi]
MSKDQLRYDRMVEGALRGVVREALSEVAEHGLPGEHHFYLTFRTHAPGVDIPDFLRTQYPGEMTIVLQYQFYGLEVTKDGFGVTLSFGGKHERLTVPLSAITTFADPSVNFALQFQPVVDTTEEEAEPAAEEAKPEPEEQNETGSATVVALDAFRKK